jgi:4-amino-4-deoxy-L-arabinose transferase-like glycosyltransferase
MIHRPTNLPITLCVLAVTLNAILLFVVIPKFTNRLTPFYNQDLYADGYDLLAGNLLKGNGYRFYPETAKTLMREPGYPIFLAGIFLIFGNGFTGVKLTNMFLALVTVWPMRRIARRVSRSQVLILGTPLLFLFHPATVIAESRGGVEILFALLLTLFALTLYRAIERNRRWDYVVSGAMLGLTVLVKSTPILFPIFLLAYLLVFEHRKGPKLAICWNIALMVIAMFVVLSPWIVRNYLLTRKFVPTASVLGVSAHAGQYIHTHLSGDSSWAQVDREAARERRKLAQELGYPFKDVTGAYYQYFYSSDDEVKFSNDLLKGVISEYQRSPIVFIRDVGSNLFNIWFRGKTWASTRINMIVQLPYLVLAIIGTVLSVRDRQFKIIAPLVCIIIYYVAAYVPILAQARYSVPLIPFLSVLACITLMTAQRRFTGEDTT